jgi:hypothetical protein
MKNLAAEFIRRAAFKASIKSREEFRKWSDDYILGFFEGLTARHSYAHPRILGLIDGMEKENDDDAGL